MNWPLFFKNRRNKFLAIFFVVGSLGCFLAHVVFYYVTYGVPTASYTAFIEIFYFIFEGGIITYLLVTNIRNDPRAYVAIMMWIFWFFFDEIRTFFYGTSVFSVLTPGVSYVIVIFALLQPLLAVACLGLGISCYILIRRYMFNRLASFRKVRLLACLYAAVSFSSSLCQVILVLLCGGAATPLLILPLVSRSAMDIGVVFTLERLRR